MEHFNRAERRAQVARLKRARRHHWSKGQKTDRQLGMLVSTPKMTSNCLCCMNPRRRGELTIHELSDRQRTLNSATEG